jgi:hypothetical protein
MADKPKVIAFWLDAEIADDDPDRAVKLRARQLCDPHYQAGRSAARLEEAAGLFADGAFDPEETWDAGLAAGLTDRDLDAAAYVALVLRETELGG